MEAGRGRGRKVGFRGGASCRAQLLGAGHHLQCLPTDPPIPRRHLPMDSYAK